MDCVFCNENGRFVLIDNHYFDRTICEDKYWIMYPTIGAYVVGYVLLVLKRHENCAAFCSHNELKQLMDRITKTYNVNTKTNKLTHTYVFEHGAPAESHQSACCINHAHIHLLPSNKDIYTDVVNRFTSAHEEYSSLYSCYEAVRNRNISSYILFGDHSRSKYCFVDSTIDVYPSQYIRQLTYYLLVEDRKQNGWDWRLYPYYQNMMDTISLFR